MDIEIKKLSPQDVQAFSKLIGVFAVVFEKEAFTMPAEKHLKSLLKKRDFFALIATHENNVVGGLTVYVLHNYYSPKPSAYIYDVGILADYQRKGIGKKLLTYLTHYCKERGFEEAFVQAETADTHAVNFYRTTSLKNEVQAIQFSCAFNESSSDDKNIFA